ncbi:hypothetical protein [uncultured Paracoccus sp.]|uniref:hypothetical protein n=1 Tax=uncultured Paracoccus sp. TaxID=189685 RepID=UPI0026187FD9|nr:hypothetical protein [uncultured Paracoccus sp.]
MVDTQPNIETPQDAIDHAAREQVEQQQPAQDAAPAEPSVEDRARAMGWVDKDQFRGPPDRWRPAEDFVKRGEDELPILRENLHRATHKITQLERDYASRIDGIQRATAIALQNQRAQIEAQYEQRMRDAVNYGDLNAYDALRNERVQAINQFDQHAVEALSQPQQQMQPQTPTYAPEQVPVVQSWTKNNPWYGRDPEMSAVAYHYSTRIGQQNPQMSLQANLAETEKYMRQRYPEAFPTSRPTASAAPVEAGGSRMGASVQRGPGVASLDAAALALGRQFVKDGLFKSLEDYAKAVHEG